MTTMVSIWQVSKNKFITNGDKSAPSYSLSEDNDYDPDAEQDDENVGMG